MREAFEKILGTENVLVDEPMYKHTTFKIGGKADFFLTPQTEKQLVDAYVAAKNQGLPVLILGNGSNLLVGDKGIRGVVICPFKKLDKIEIAGNEMFAECGALLARASSEALKASLSGLEFASGIPGTIGGGIYMNAGAYGYELKDITKSVRFMDEEGKIFEVDAASCEFGYRTSIFAKKGYTILGCTFKLEVGDPEKIRESINNFTVQRVSKQPVEKPSAGSVFKRPEGFFAGTLIEQAGLKGFSVGGAQVSEKHAGFIINTGDATALDVARLIKHIQDTVYKKDGVRLETEIKMVGEF